MKLSEYLAQGKFLCKQAKLNVNITLNNGTSKKRGDIVSVIMENADGSFHIEHNDFACKVNRNEIEFID